MNKQNIYYAARAEASRQDRRLASRDRAAELIHVSLQALTDYENGMCTPPCDAVACMCSTYRVPALRNQHMRDCCPLMLEGVAESSELTRAALRWVTALCSVDAIGMEFAAISLDGRIDATEVAAAMSIRKKAVELTQVMQETITAIDTALCGTATGGNRHG